MTFVPGKTWVRTSGQTTGPEEVAMAIEAVQTEWWTAAGYTKRFENELAWYLTPTRALFCNSGSSANLLAMSALARYLGKGAPVITTAAGFPTTVGAILHAGLQPVFVDVSLGDYNAIPDQIELAIGRWGGGVGVFLAHTLGNPWHVPLTNDYFGRNVIWVEDNCDALGASWDGARTGTWGLASTCSFYPAHQITTGEGGAVFSSDADFLREAESFRDWGRDCWCPPGCTNTCGKRFDQPRDVLGNLPDGYDHKYVYRNVGYNLKATDIQAAIGLAQVKKLPDFVEARRANWTRLHLGMTDLEEFFILPWHHALAKPSWFGFALTVREGAPFSRLELLRFLESRRIDTRLLFGGNLTKQPAFRGVGIVMSDLTHTDLIAERTFWVGCWPGLTHEMLDYVIESFHDFAGVQ